MSKPAKKACGENGKCPNKGACKKAAKKAFDKKGGESLLKPAARNPLMMERNLAAAKLYLDIT